MAILDILLVLIIVGFILWGIWTGFSQMISNILATILGLIIASFFSPWVFAHWGYIFISDSLAKIIIFVLLFAISSRLISVLFWLLTKVFTWLIWIPFAGLVDRLLGGVLGLIEAILIIVGLLYFSTQHIPADILLPILKTSFLGSILTVISISISAFKPVEINQTQKTIETVKNSLNQSGVIIEGVKNQIESGRSFYEQITTNTSKIKY